MSTLYGIYLWGELLHLYTKRKYAKKYAERHAKFWGPGGVTIVELTVVK